MSMTPVITPVTATSADASASTPPKPTPPAEQATPGKTTPAKQAQPDKTDSEQLAAHLDDALKNSDYKAEIVNGRNGAMFVRIVQAETGQLLMQLPPQAVIDLVASMNQGSRGAASAPVLPSGGTLIDELA